MAVGRDEDDAAGNAAEGGDNDGGGVAEGGRGTKVLEAVFSSCESDPRGAVHRTWGVALIFIAMLFVSAIIEVVGLSQHGGPIAFAISAGICGLAQLASAVVGTFVLKRFPTRFSVGFFLGLVVILSQQCLLSFVAFGSRRHVGGEDGDGGHSSRVFANLSLALFSVYGVFALMLVHFREHILLAPVDAEKFARGSKDGGGRGDGGSLDEGASYENFGER